MMSCADAVEPSLKCTNAHGVSPQCSSDFATTAASNHAVLDYLVEDEAITEEFAHRLLSWKHSGFSVDNTVGVGANDPQGRPAGPLYDPQSVFA